MHSVHAYTAALAAGVLGSYMGDVANVRAERKESLHNQEFVKNEQIWPGGLLAGILSKNGGHHAIPHRKQPLEMIFSNFFQKSIFPLHT